MKYVAQEDEMGCAVACVANLLQINYQEAKKLFNPKYAKNRGYYCRSVVNGLKRAEIQSHYKKYSETEGANVGDIVFFGKCLELPYGHWVLKAEQGWVDPWINFQIVKDITKARAGVRQMMPGIPKWVVCLKHSPHILT